ncbi:MAG: hypothetical protein COV66_13240 [Nitrospinae bacterium CG11_big_fil_rev_8_21_14_0_20_45_15]|nr:MAG: hypothetical protein COV66_13240 [Nitrospinae bacterium CG11_big_fil_rev_8_21_14_0_20_45_15]
MKICKKLFLSIAVAFLLPLCSAQAQEPTPQSSIEIVADRMRSENSGQKIIFSGNVTGVWGELSISSDVLEVYNTEDKKGTQEIVALGSVKITRGETRAEGDRAVYLDAMQKIILTGTPQAKAWQGKDIIEGREMIFLLDKDRFVVNQRVRMKLFPKSKDDQKKPERVSSFVLPHPPQSVATQPIGNS